MNITMPITWQSTNFSTWYKEHIKSLHSIDEDYELLNQKEL
jgi:hypothetical protein